MYGMILSDLPTIRVTILKSIGWFWVIIFLWQLFKLLVSYCWWTKSCTTKDDDYPIIYRFLTIPGGCLGFRPSTVFHEPPCLMHQKFPRRSLLRPWVWWPLLVLWFQLVHPKHVTRLYEQDSRSQNRPRDWGGDGWGWWIYIFSKKKSRTFGL